MAEENQDLRQRHDQQEPFLQWLIDLSDTEDAPLVNSASYSDKERTVEPDYMTRIKSWETLIQQNIIYLLLILYYIKQLNSIVLLFRIYR